MDQQLGSGHDWYNHRRPEGVPLEVQVVVEDWWIADTAFRPHSALNRPTTPRPVTGPRLLVHSL